jgi:hypothetical protein
MIYCKELNRNFDNKEDLFKALAENESVIIDAKKSEIYKSYEKGLQVVSEQKLIEKALNSEENKAIKFDSNYYYFVVNSANYLDSHKDVHLKGNWNKTVKEKQSKNYLIWHHDFSKVENIIAFPEDIEMFTANISWKLLGKNYEGETYCLIYKVAKDKIQNKTIKEWLELGKKLQLSVRMQYVKVLIAFKSDEKEYEEYNKNYNEIYPLIVNKSDFKEEDLLWVYGVKESNNVMESSILPYGSNDATAEISNNESKEEQLDNDTQIEIKDEQSDDTQTTEMLKQLLNKF